MDQQTENPGARAGATGVKQVVKAASFNLIYIIRAAILATRFFGWLA